MKRLLLCSLVLSASPVLAGPDVFRTERSVAAENIAESHRGGVACLFNAPTGELALDEAIERILCHDPQTAQAWAEAKAQAAQLGVAWSAYLPRLGASLGSSDGRSRTDYLDFDGVESSARQKSLNANLELSWVLFDFGRRRAALRSARQLLVAANASHQAMLQSAFVDAAQTYYDALAAQDTLAAAEQVRDMAAENYQAADAKYAAGAAALSDRLQAQTAQSQSELRLVRARGNLDNALGVLALRMGLPAESRFQLTSELALMPDTTFVSAIDRLLAQARDRHPQLIAAQARVEAASQRVHEVRAEGLPTLALTGSLSHSRNDLPRALNGDTRQRDTSIGLQLNIPLFEGFERNYRVRGAKAEVQASRAALAGTEQQVSLLVWGSYQRLMVDSQSLNSTDALVAQSRQALEVTQGRYRAGVGSMIELLNALSAYADAREQHIRALADWQSARLQLAAGLGRLGFWALR
ncbi:outer membrane protein [Pseudomonas delhiensis]|uniref:Protein CyaE n=1 Tax=Pseudomonas delhiensis TaxID=366289 RepID=A0A239FZ75_9PSED|nr:TolC family protein [Pseudomonas delhiensis]SDL00778.1 outer membrane protein [Pseudomonas delhiensis]SNS62476.1 outer membrane protein [Pseudomonas delhiensis]